MENKKKLQINLHEISNQYYAYMLGSHHHDVANDLLK